ncbi:MAG: helix-turn-helix transcriptional regulator [Oscillatoria sp. Prado101]|jgi:DNA-binding transcriptional regulator YiaG|nr:helix-turn-helix transcriptional regulator [Oscillatoria sp. Prado101]
MPVTQQQEIAQLVRETRRRLGLSQQKFAAQLGVSFQSVNRWENGRTQPLPLALKRIEELLQSMGAGGQDLLDRHFSQGQWESWSKKRQRGEA